MGVPRKSEVRPFRPTDPLWWGLAALLGLVSLWLPHILQMGADRTTQLVMTESALFFSGSVIGCLRPDRVWRWGLACLVAFIVRDLAQFATVTKAGVLSYLAGNAALYAVHTIPVLAGAYIGAYMLRGGQR
ncbi:MAG: hypothetical protein ABSE56_19975 [Bryobacteraceae bacterium]